MTSIPEELRRQVQESDPEHYDLTIALAESIAEKLGSIPEHMEAPTSPIVQVMKFVDGAIDGFMGGPLRPEFADRVVSHSSDGDVGPVAGLTGALLAGLMNADAVSMICDCWIAQPETPDEEKDINEFIAGGGHLDFYLGASDAVMIAGATRYGSAIIGHRRYGRHDDGSIRWDNVGDIRMAPASETIGAMTVANGAQVDLPAQMAVQFTKSLQTPNMGLGALGSMVVLDSPDNAVHAEVARAAIREANTNYHDPTTGTLWSTTMANDVIDRLTEALGG